MPDVDPFTVPIAERYFEDYPAGLVAEFGSVTVSEPEIIEFATAFDPQYLHVDPAAAAAGPYGGLIASGWHTAGITMRLIVDNYLSQVASLGGPGADELRWPLPVRPGDTLWARATVVEARRSESKPDRGIVRTRCELHNQDDAVVFSTTVTNFLLSRDAAVSA